MRVFGQATGFDTSCLSRLTRWSGRDTGFSPCLWAVPGYRHTSRHKGRNAGSPFWQSELRQGRRLWQVGLQTACRHTQHQVLITIPYIYIYKGYLYMTVVFCTSSTTRQVAVCSLYTVFSVLLHPPLCSVELLSTVL